MMHGCKTKPKRNISGLCNQPQQPVPTLHLPTPTQPPSISSISTANSDVESDAEWIPNLELDSMKMHLHAESDDEQLNMDLEEWGKWDMGTESFYVNLMQLAVDNNDDPQDEDWIPEALKRKEMN